jgi:hypothetical protein
LIPQHVAPLPPLDKLPDAVEAQTYIFLDLRHLESKLWSWDEFIENSAWKWYGGSPEDDTPSDSSPASETLHAGAVVPEVERRRAAMLAVTGNA